MEQFLTNDRYSEYLNSSEWKAKRRAVKKCCGGVCERCQRFAFDEVHHLTYERRFDEPLEDLQGVCVACHRFIHERSSIDPLVPSIHVKVCCRVIEYLDPAACKRRRVRIDQLPPSAVKKMRTVKKLRGGFSLPGEYDIPIDEFLDENGTPRLDPSRWEKYRTPDRATMERRAADHDLAARERRAADRERAAAAERQRFRDSPELFTSFKGSAITPGKAMALFLRCRTIIHFWRESQIANVRETKRGVVLDLVDHKVPGRVSLFTIYNADRRLAQGRILYDNDRRCWVAIDQKPPAIAAISADDWIATEWEAHEKTRR